MGDGEVNDLPHVDFDTLPVLVLLQQTTTTAAPANTSGS